MAVVLLQFIYIKNGLSWLLQTGNVIDVDVRADRWINGRETEQQIIFSNLKLEMKSCKGGFVLTLSSSLLLKLFLRKSSGISFPTTNAGEICKWQPLTQLAMLFSWNYKMLKTFFLTIWFLLSGDAQRSRSVPEESLRLLQMASSLSITYRLKNIPTNRLRHSKKVTESPYLGPQQS